MLEHIQAPDLKLASSGFKLNYSNFFELRAHLSSVGGGYANFDDTKVSTLSKMLSDYLHAGDSCITGEYAPKRLLL